MLYSAHTMKRILLMIAVVAILLLGAGWTIPNPIFWNSLEVKVTAYNSTPGQTSGDPFLAAWGDQLEPGMQCVAVSRDLLQLGVGHRTSVHLDGIGGPYLVLDKTNKRFTRRVDVYFGVDVEAAREFGVKETTMYWR